MYPARVLMREDKFNIRQTGVGVIEFFFILAVICAIGWIGFKLAPLYHESIETERILEQIINDPSVVDLNEKDIALSIIRRLDVNGFPRIKEESYGDYLTITKNVDRVVITAKWRAESALFANLFLVADFTQQVRNY